MKIQAFTLAEVLITLGIIGIVASMTMPALVNLTQNKELETQYKQAYSIISQALNRLNSEQGFVANYDNYRACTDDFAKAYKEYFVKLVDCGKDGCSSSTGKDEDGKETGLDKYRSFTGNYSAAGWLDDGQYTVANTMFIAVNHCTPLNKITIGVDVNGINKKPNRFGHDFFLFQIQEDGKLLPMGAPNTTATRWSGDYKNYCKAGSTNVANGFTCAYRAMTEKDYFKNLPKS